MVLGNRIYITLPTGENGAQKKIAALKSCKLSTGCETIEIASNTSGAWRAFIAGRNEWSMSCSWLVLSTSAMKTNALRIGTTRRQYTGKNTVEPVHDGLPIHASVTEPLAGRRQGHDAGTCLLEKNGILRDWLAVATHRHRLRPTRRQLHTDASQKSNHRINRQ